MEGRRQGEGSASVAKLRVRRWSGPVWVGRRKFQESHERARGKRRQVTEPDTRKGWPGSTTRGESSLLGSSLCCVAGSRQCRSRAQVAGRLDAGVLSSLPIWLLGFASSSQLLGLAQPVGDPPLTLPKSNFRPFCCRTWGSIQFPWLSVCLMSMWSPQDNCSGQL